MDEYGTVKKRLETFFWELEKRIKQDKKKPGVIINIRKQEMLFEIIRLINDGAITMDDLSDFSDELRNQVNGFYKKRTHD